MKTSEIFSSFFHSGKSNKCFHPWPDLSMCPEMPVHFCSIHFGMYYSGTCGCLLSRCMQFGPLLLCHYQPVKTAVATLFFHLLLYTYAESPTCLPKLYCSFLRIYCKNLDNQWSAWAIEVHCTVNLEEMPGGQSETIATHNILAMCASKHQ